MGMVLEFKNINNILRACLNFVQQHFYCSKFHHFFSRIEREFVVPAEFSVIIEARDLIRNLQTRYYLLYIILKNRLVCKIEYRHRFPAPIFSFVSVKSFLLGKSSRCLCIEQERVGMLTVYYSGYSIITVWVTDYLRGLNELRINIFYSTSLLCIKVFNSNAYINKVNKYTNQQS